MNEEINELISHYEEEKTQLELWIKGAVEQSDYKSAHVNQKALIYINNQLRIFKALNDPYYLKKEEYENHISLYEKISLNHEQISDYIKEQIQKIRLNLDDLNSRKIAAFHDGQEFDDAVFDLVENKISAFIFNLRKEENLYIKFSVKKNKIIIRLTPFADILVSDYFNKSTVTVLKQIGFTKNKLRTCFQIKYPLDSFKDASPIKTIVSRVIYEAFYNYQVNKSTTLEIIPQS